MRAPRPTTTVLFGAALAVLLLSTSALSGKQKKSDAAKENQDPYADYVWPPPPDRPRIKLERVILGRTDLEGESKFAKALIGASPKSPWDDLKKPHAVAFDPQGRILVTDAQTGALLRFDLAGRKMDILGTQGAVRLKTPLGLDVGADGTIYVADIGLGKVVSFSPEGKPKTAYGRPGELLNPTDAAISPDGRKLFVTDSKAHKVVIFDAASGAKAGEFGKPGDKDGELAFPSGLAFGPDGSLFVVDQINSRVQVFSPAGDYLAQFGRLGVGFANFVRPKDAAIDEAGLIYVTDNAFNNIQIFDVDFTLLTFVGEGGTGPGRFSGLSGVAVQKDRIAAVDQLGHQLQVFRFIAPKDAD